jgi:hypothetical protein
MDKANGEQKQEGPRVMAQISITLVEGNQMLVNGPIDDLVLFYGMLEMAHDIVADRKREMKASQGIVIAPASVLPRSN